MSAIKTIIIALCFLSCFVFYLELRARYMYQWQDGGGDIKGSRMGVEGEGIEIEEGDDDVNIDTAPQAVDVYEFFSQPDVPLVASRYKIQERLGAGFVSRAYSGLDLRTQQKVVLKFTYINITENSSPTPLKGIPDNVLKLKALQNEYSTYKSFTNTRLLQAFFYGEYNGFKVLVTQQAGKSLQQLQELNRKWLKEDVNQIARNIILDLEQVHDKSYIHNDMHTGNIAFDVNESTYRVNLIDFNSCKRFRDTDTFQHFEQKRNFFRVPIHRFSPPCYYQGKTCSRRDDMTSLGYMLVMLASEYANCAPIYSFSCPAEKSGAYWFGPPLPWVQVTGKQNMIDFMKNISFDILNAPNDYRHQLPDNFRKYFEHLQTLQFTTRPDYAHLVSLFPVTDKQ